MEPMLFKQLAAQFQLDTKASLKTLGEGHIHQTYLVQNDKQVVLQKVNTLVFPNQQSLMKNFACAVTHLAEKKLQKNYPYDVLNLLPTTSGQLFYQDDQHGFWRAFNFVPETVCLQTASTAEQAFQAAQAFGAFNRALFDCQVDQFDEVISDFHNIHARFEQLEQAKQDASEERLTKASDTLVWVQSHYHLVIAFDLLVIKGLPLRITHNDTKINNVLLNAADGAARCVIDLDTVMPGYLLYDFGDMVRTVASPEKEDSTNFENIKLRQEILAALVAGYMDSLGDVITPLEVESLALGAKLLPYMISIRFLADYLRGDDYFKVDYPEHNLIRAQNQLTLLESILEHNDELQVLLQPYLS
tara:strand:+ start:27714 stop:28790 length:1077 start_codon:yes stop_codon:yes gene_type:complete